MRLAPTSGMRLDGVATIFGLFGEDFGRIHEVTRVEYSGERLSADACEPLRLGMTVCVGFQARGVEARRGVVESCEASTEGWRVAVRFDGQLAA